MARQKSLHVDDASAVGRRLREAREQAGLTQRALAFAGCSPAYISRIEAGQRVPSLQLLREFGRRLAVSADYLATGSSERPNVSRSADAEVALRLDDVETARGIYNAMSAEGEPPQARSKAFEGLGQIALREGRFREAADLLEGALAIAGDDPADRLDLAPTLAQAYAASGDLPPAIALLERCLKSSAALADPVQYVRLATLLGAALTDVGDFAAAEQTLAKALERGREVADAYTRARLYWSQSRLLAEQGQAEQAEAYARRTLETLRATEDTYAIAHILETLAHICIELQRPAEALDLLREGDPLIEAAGTPVEIAHYRLEEARALAALGERDQASALAMTIAGQLAEAQPVSSGRAYLLLGELFDDLGEPARAKELYELAIERAAQQGPNKHLVRAYRRLAELLKIEGRRDEALELLERALGAQEAAGRLLA